MGMALRVPRYTVDDLEPPDTQLQPEVSKRPKQVNMVRDAITWSVPTAELAVLIDLGDVFAGLS